jgi:hypothetical protein
MIRKILIFTVLAVTAAAAIVLPLWKSDAAQQRTSIGSPASRALPNFDIRLTDRGEFNDMDLSSTSGKQLRCKTLSLALELPQLSNSVRLSQLSMPRIFAR